MSVVIKYPGAKNRIADWVCSFIPPHDVYLEPFFGGGAIFFNKKQKAHIETINDLNDDVFNFFKTLRDDPESLTRAIELTAYSRGEYDYAWSDPAGIDNVERARRFNTRDVFIYLDPPYLLSTRKGNMYHHEMTDEQHLQLLREIVNHPAKIMISGYESDMYNSVLKNWHKETKNTLAESSQKRTEVLWMNYLPENKLF